MRFRFQQRFPILNRRRAGIRFLGQTRIGFCYLVGFSISAIAIIVLAVLSRLWCEDSLLVSTYERVSPTYSIENEETIDLTSMSDASLRHEDVCRSFIDSAGTKFDPLQYDYPHSGSASEKKQTKGLAVVTAYFRMRPFCKAQFVVFDPDLYLRWMAAYSRIINPVIFYTDDEEMARHFLALRNSPKLQKLTYVCLLHRSALWSFELLPEIRRVLAREDYPKFVPNTVMPEYGAIQHAKYALMRLAINSNPFKAKYFGWFDIGIFRLLAEYSPATYSKEDQSVMLLLKSDLIKLGYFQLDLPPNFDPTRISYNKVLRSKPRFDLNVSDYFTRDLVLFGGGVFVGEAQVLADWLTEYEKFARLMLSMGWSSTDQQVLYAMHCEALRPYRNASLRIQSYSSPRYVEPLHWFFLPLLMRQKFLERVLYNRSLVYNHEPDALDDSVFFQGARNTIVPSKSTVSMTTQVEFNPVKFPLPLKYWAVYYISVLSEWLSSPANA